MFQKTIKKVIYFSGNGLHTGKLSQVCLKPGKINSGINFILNKTIIPFTINNILPVQRSIIIGNKKNYIMTVEHLTAALYMLGITNLNIEVNNIEMPALDGSALSFLKILKKAGIQIQNITVLPLTLKNPIKVTNQDKFIIALPSDQLKITYAIDFNHPLLRNKSIHFDNINEKIFSKQIASARTFGFMDEVSILLKKGLAHGGNLNNTVVLSKDGILNKKLRFKDECIRHKVLDFIGALAFLNRPMLAHFLVYKSGHKLDIQLIKLLLKNLK